MYIPIRDNILHAVNFGITELTEIKDTPVWLVSQLPLKRTVKTFGYLYKQTLSLWQICRDEA
jgi:hypothetical protein